MAPMVGTRRATSPAGCSPASDDRRPSSPRATPRRSASSPRRSEAGLHVPDDLSVIGYDDIEAADYVGLTTIRQQLFESGAEARRSCCPRSTQRSDEPPVAHLAPELVVRGTTAPPKEGRA